MKSFQRKQFVIGLLLASLMASTRSHHFDSLTHLPDASLAVFLLAGIYLPVMAFPILLVVAGLSDYFAFNYVGVSDWCFSPAYWFLIPTYAVLFYAGGFCANRLHETWRELGLFSLVSFAAVSAAFLISNLTFFLFSGRFANMGVEQYAAQVVQYYLPYITSAGIYLLPLVLYRLRILLHNRQPANLH